MIPIMALVCIEKSRLFSKFPITKVFSCHQNAAAFTEPACKILVIGFFLEPDISKTEINSRDVTSEHRHPVWSSRRINPMVNFPRSCVFPCRASLGLLRNMEYVAYGRTGSHSWQVLSNRFPKPQQLCIIFLLTSNNNSANLLVYYSFLLQLFIRQLRKIAKQFFVLPII